MAVALWAVTVLCAAFFTMMGLPKEGGWAAKVRRVGLPAMVRGLRRRG
jgi:hypothetical protein